MKWTPADADPLRVKLHLIKARALRCKTAKDAEHLHCRGAVWVAEHRGKHYVLQCDHMVDRHRVIAEVSSGFAAYLLRGQIEALLTAASDLKATDNVNYRRVVRACGLRMPKKGWK